MHPQFYKLKSVDKGKIYSEEESVTICPETGAQLEVEYDKEYIRKTLNIEALKSSPPSGIKYLSFYPIRDYTKVVTLNEGNTPLIHCKNLGEKKGLDNLYIKYEGANPTGVFKDRGSMVEITKARELGAKAICVASTGNMAASVSAYAALAGMECYVLVPEGSPMGKMAQTLAYGGRVIQIRGSYGDCVDMCQAMAKKYNFYLAGDYAFRLEGAKSLAYEIVEQLNWRVPDVVIVPMGCGTNIAGVWKGFKDFYEYGLIDKLPKMVGVQAENADSIVDAWRKKNKRYTYIKNPKTVCSAICIGAPQDDVKALNSINESNGYAETSNDHETLEALHEIAQNESLFVEASCAVPVACIEKLKKAKVIKKTDTVVCVATGIGLKDPKAALALMPDPPVLEPKTEEIDKYLELKLYEIKGNTNNEKVLLDTVPTEKKLGTLIKKEFNIQLGNVVLKGIKDMVKEFLGKGRNVSYADLQNIIETFLNEFSSKKKVLEIKDFTLNDSKSHKATAEVTVNFHGKKHQSEGHGDGAFDAITAALDTIIKKEKLKIRLTSWTNMH